MPRLHGYRERHAHYVIEDMILVPNPAALVLVRHLPPNPPDPPHNDFPTARVVRWSGKR